MKFPINTQFATDGNILYGMTFDGGTNDMGIIFKINTDGTGFRKLLDFNGAGNGAHPSGSMLLSGTTLYGMTVYGGENNVGTIFKINTDGSGFRKFFDFERQGSGASPEGSLILSGSGLYGMTSEGGIFDYGVIFKINTDGTGFQKLFDFDSFFERACPRGSLKLAGTRLYGVTSKDEDYNSGLVFKINIDGTGFQRLPDLNYPNAGLNRPSNLGNYETFCIGANGYGAIFQYNNESVVSFKLPHIAEDNKEIYPWESLTCLDMELYGMTSYGGRNDMGIIFKMNPDGKGVQKLCDFDGINCGAYPYGSLTKAGPSLFGVTSRGGTNNSGVVFKISMDGTSFRKIYDFEGYYADEESAGLVTLEEFVPECVDK